MTTPVSPHAATGLENAGSVAAPPQSSRANFIRGRDHLIRRRLLISRLFALGCRLLTYSALAILAVLLISIFSTSLGRLNLDFLRSLNSSDPLRAGMLAGIWGSFWLILLTALFSIPVGVATAVWLEEYATDNRLTRLIKLNLSNLAGVPSIVYGILGLTVFVHMFDVFDKPRVINAAGLFRIPLPLGDKVLAGGLTMSLVVLPIVIIAAQEAIRAVPRSIRVASLALGATRWQTIRHQVLPAALPGISTGVILAMCRAIGETAPLIMIGALTRARFTPAGIDSPVKLLTQPQRILQAPFDQFTAMPIEVFSWARQPDERFRAVAASGIVVLLGLLLVINGAAMFVRYRAGRKLKW
jgi:phosphate transport system permease protein